MQRVGMPKGPVACMFKTIQDLKHSVCTVFGDSTREFGGHLWIIPVHGVGQGNGAGPTIWAVVSAPVLDMMHDREHGTNFSTTISQKDIKFVGFAFVDDTDLIHSAKSMEDDFTKIGEAMQASVDDWEGGICATGGAIVPEKSHWYLVSFDWTGSDWKYSSTAHTPYEVTVRNADGIRIPLPRMESSEATMTLGVFLAPDGNNNAAVDHLRNKTEEWRDQIRSSHLQKYEAWYALTSTIWKSIEYPLPALTMTYKECAYIMAPAKEGGLSKSRICQKLPLEAVHGPLRYQGLGLNHIKITQEVSHLEIIRQHIWRDTPTSRLIQENTEELHLEIGLGGNIFDYPYTPFRKAVTECWLLNTWEFIDQHPFTYTELGPYLELQCVGDQYLTKLFLDCGYSGASLRKLLMCRKHLEVTTLADITTGDGK